jgi:hypothetical protein
VAHGPQTPAQTGGGPKQRDAARPRAREPSSVPVKRRKRLLDAMLRAPGTRKALPVGELTHARHHVPPALGRVDRLVLPGAGQVLVGIEVWHVRRATLQTDEKLRPPNSGGRIHAPLNDLQRRLQGVCGGLATVAGLGLRNKFVTSATATPAGRISPAIAAAGRARSPAPKAGALSAPGVKRGTRRRPTPPNLRRCPAGSGCPSPAPRAP